MGLAHPNLLASQLGLDVVGHSALHGEGHIQSVLHHRDDHIPVHGADHRLGLVGHGNGVGNVGAEQRAVGHQLISGLALLVLGPVNKGQDLIIDLLLHTLHLNGVDNVAGSLHHGGPQPAGHLQGHRYHDHNGNDKYQQVNDVDFSKQFSVFHLFSP